MLSGRIYRHGMVTEYGYEDHGEPTSPADDGTWRGKGDRIVARIREMAGE